MYLVYTIRIKIILKKNYTLKFSTMYVQEIVYYIFNIKFKTFIGAYSENLSDSLYQILKL